MHLGEGKLHCAQENKPIILLCQITVKKLYEMAKLVQNILNPFLICHSSLVNPSAKNNIHSMISLD
ncbi:unnamed protein product [Paramecium pentaurelia]|uniref:Uncharacterized protein n=1 Tax=Paramecium pentaurelia TaxID=43138 RepID=A0A8S1X609_9CILI|nr:unnamed protein product [Paramecium pentaurelia]